MRITARRPRRPVPVLALLLLFSGGGVAGAYAAASRYNSEEHKLLVDAAAAGVVVPPSVRLPVSIEIRRVSPDSYREPVRLAKTLAVADGSGRWVAAQDNCFWGAGYGQRTGNLKIHVPPADQAPGTILVVPAHVQASGPPLNYTIGHLASIYGDYRTVPYCETPGTCVLTNADLETVHFRGNVRGGEGSRYCPEPMGAGVYLGRIGAGLWPPFGTAGNVLSPTAGPTEHDNAGWWGDEMMRIAFINDWHFSNVAVAWYTGMHRLALLYADSARGDPDYWVKALHYEANALHSLTDLFAFGHVVTNRDETSHRMVDGRGLGGKPAREWMDNVVRMGGGVRGGGGRVAPGSAFPPLADRPGVRNAFLATAGHWTDVSLVSRSHKEHSYHDYFNRTGATVRSLSGHRFRIHGDGDLHATWVADLDRNIPVRAARASLQALFDAYAALEDGRATVAELASPGSDYFAALTFIPVYIESDHEGYFTGMWTRYARAVNEITGTGKELGWWDQCQIPFLSGADWGWPDKRDRPCAEF